jgi:flagellin
MAASILTNTSAMVALRTLRATNSKLSDVQGQISTGKAVATAKDNASVFAISKVMESDVGGFKAISDSLSLGASTVAVASNGANQIGEILNEIKGKIVSANEDNVDRQKIQNEIVSLRDQITGIVNTAQFNGLNLINGSVTSGNLSILSSLDRDASGGVSTGAIAVSTQNLSVSAGLDVSAASVTAVDPGTAGVIDANDGGTNDNVAVGGFVFLDASGAATSTVALKRDAAGVDNSVATGLVEGDEVSLTIGNITGRYTIQVGDNAAAVVGGLKNALISSGLDGNDFTLDVNTTAGDLAVTNNTNADASFSFASTRGTGGLAGLNSVDVTSTAGAAAALSNVEGFIQTAINAQAAFGTGERRIEIQNEFMNTLIDNFKSGIGALVDADLEEASARLQALQVTTTSASTPRANPAISIDLPTPDPANIPSR